MPEGNGGTTFGVNLVQASRTLPSPNPTANLVGVRKGVERYAEKQNNRSVQLVSTVDHMVFDLCTGCPSIPNRFDKTNRKD